MNNSYLLHHSAAPQDNKTTSSSNDKSTQHTKTTNERRNGGPTTIRGSSSTRNSPRTFKTKRQLRHIIANCRTCPSTTTQHRHTIICGCAPRDSRMAPQLRPSVHAARGKNGDSERDGEFRGFWVYWSSNHSFFYRCSTLPALSLPCTSFLVRLLGSSATSLASHTRHTDQWLQSGPNKKVGSFFSF